MKLNNTSIAAFPSYHHDVLFHQYLSIIYADVKNKYQSQSKKTNIVSEANGEILYPSINKLFSNIRFTEQDIFFDLGSGRGKMVLHVYLQTFVKEAYGIELLTDLYEQALLARERVYSDLHDYTAKRTLAFLLGDFFIVPFHTATIVFINSVCFGQDMMLHLGDLINTIPSIHTLITLRPIHHLQHLSFKKAIHVEGSWDSALCYIYGK